MRKYNIGICLIALITMLYLETHPLIAITTCIVVYIINKFPNKPSSNNGLI